MMSYLTSTPFLVLAINLTFILGAVYAQSLSGRMIYGFIAGMAAILMSYLWWDDGRNRC
jgi:NADH:ubiquinone oxidoreductase subunit K